MPSVGHELLFDPGGPVQRASGDDTLVPLPVVLLCPPARSTHLSQPRGGGASTPSPPTNAAARRPVGVLAGWYDCSPTSVSARLRPAGDLAALAPRALSKRWTYSHGRPGRWAMPKGTTAAASEPEGTKELPQYGPVQGCGQPIRGVPAGPWQFLSLSRERVRTNPRRFIVTPNERPVISWDSVPELPDLRAQSFCTRSKEDCRVLSRLGVLKTQLPTGRFDLAVLLVDELLAR